MLFLEAQVFKEECEAACLWSRQLLAPRLFSQGQVGFPQLKNTEGRNHALQGRAEVCQWDPGSPRK